MIYVKFNIIGGEEERELYWGRELIVVEKRIDRVGVIVVRIYFISMKLLNKCNRGYIF